MSIADLFEGDVSGGVVLIKLKKYKSLDKGRYLAVHDGGRFDRDGRDRDSQWALVHEKDSHDALWELEPMNGTVVKLKKHASRRYLAAQTLYNNDRRDEKSGRVWVKHNRHDNDETSWILEIEPGGKNLIRLQKHSHPHKGRYLTTTHVHPLLGCLDEASSWALVHERKDNDSLWELVDARAAMLSISYEQLLEIRDQCTKQFGRRSFSKMTMRDINNHIIIPMCQKTRTSYARYLNPEGRHVDTFVTHSWDEPFGEFVKSIERHYRGYLTKPNLWICAFALIQGDPETIQRQLNVGLEDSPFALALREASSFLVVRNRTTDVLSRIWCVCELYFAKKDGFYPNKTAVIGPDTFRCTRTPWAKASAFDHRDKERIVKAIRKSGDEAELDEFINQVRSHTSQLSVG